MIIVPYNTTMPEKEPKFINQETKKVSQEAEDKIEKKEVEKSPKEMLKDALPFAWGKALEFAQENGFDDPEEIKKRIDLAKKYNLEVEHFFYDPEQLKKEVPTQELFKKTAKESEYVRELIKELSIQSKKPVLCIFNARGGTIYSYGADNLNTCLNSQFEELAKKEKTTIQKLRDEFVNELKGNDFWQGSQKKEVIPLLKKQYKCRAILEVVRDWITQDRFNYMLANWTDFKISSYQFDMGDEKIDLENKISLSRFAALAKDGVCDLMFVDASFSKFPASFRGIEGVMKDGRLQDIFSITNKEDKDSSVLVKELIQTKRDLKNASCVLVNAWRNADEEPSPWFDNFPQVLSKVGKKFAHGHKYEVEESVYSVERLVQSAQQVEYLSEKVKNALRYYQKDEQGRNWFERNFEGIMLGKKDAPQKGTSEYLAMFKKWVPYETDKTGEAVLDDSGYPVPRKTAPMTVAAEDELARIEAAMEELE